jgi:hemolysin activation/secretion protein
VRRLRGYWSALLWAIALAPCAAQAQVIERNLPAQSAPPPAVIIGPADLQANSDDTTLAPAVRQIVVLGAEDASLDGAGPAVASGLLLERAPDGQRIHFTRPLARFLGQPLSRKRISQIEAAIVTAYRRAGRPFVDVSTPPQDIGKGRLQIRVVEFRLGHVKVTGTTPADAAHVKASVRAQPGQPIDADLLSQDLDWLNRYPFRTLSATFSPGEALGQTNLTLSATRGRPYSVYAGYANSGSPATGEDRYFVGALVGLPMLRDATASYQLTGSRDFWDDHGRVLDDPHPLYLGQGGRLAIPTAPRQALELTISAVETNQPAQVFVIRSVTTEATLGYRIAASDLWRVLPGDLNAGIEAKRQHRDTLFGTVSVASGAISVYQAFVGWSGNWTDAYGHTAVDATIHVSPGGLSPGDRSAAYQAFTFGRVRHADYTVVNADFNRVTNLPWRLLLSNDVSAQFGGVPLPDSERIALGGAQAVRGYTLDDGAYDDGITLRNALRLKGPAVFENGLMTLDPPFLIGDIGAARDAATRRSRTLSGVGVGWTAHVGPAAVSLTVTDPLVSGPATHANQWRADVRVAASY